jgi:anti-sigma regulatory factor (Ser/Thr protein kinase)
VTLPPAPGAADDEGDPRRSADIALSLGPDAASEARQAVRGVLSEWRLSDDGLVDDAALVASELVTNAVRHGGKHVDLEVDLVPDEPAGPDATAVRVAVRDGSAVLPRLRAVGDDEEGGRGLAIVAGLAADWGTENTPEGGKRVWVVLRSGAVEQATG